MDWWQGRERARERRDPIFMVVFSTNPDLWLCSWPRAEFPSQCFASDRVARAAVEWDGCRRDRISIPLAFLPLSEHFLEHHYTRRTPRIVVNPRKPFVCCYFSFFFRATQNCVVSPLPTLHSTLCVFFLCCRNVILIAKNVCNLYLFELLLLPCLFSFIQDELPTKGRVNGIGRDNVCSPRQIIIDTFMWTRRFCALWVASAFLFRPRSPFSEWWILI